VQIDTLLQTHVGRILLSVAILILLVFTVVLVAKSLRRTGG
jgi:hypothetical protein